MTLLKNLILFPLLFLPLVAMASMLLEAALGERSTVPPEWRVGWNPILWLVVTAPWHAPLILVVPILHVMSRSLRRRVSYARTRSVLAGASPILFSLAMLVLYGPDNFRPDLLTPVIMAAAAYGVALRIPGDPDRTALSAGKGAREDAKFTAPGDD